MCGMQHSAGHRGSWKSSLWELYWCCHCWKKGCSAAFFLKQYVSLTYSPIYTFINQTQILETALTSSIRFCFSSKPFLAVLVKETNTKKKKER